MMHLNEATSSHGPDEILEPVPMHTESRQPCGVFQQMAEVDTPCKWIQGMRVKIKEYPEKLSDYMMENGQLYRNLGHRADDEDYFPWKLCVPSSNRVRVLQEKRSNSEESSILSDPTSNVLATILPDG